MADQSQSAKKLSTGRGPAPPWLRWAAVCVLLIVVPISIYLFLYQRSRVEQATIRNFRTLDAAADRVVTVLGTLSSVVDSSSFGISPTMLDEVTERVTGQTDPIAVERTGCTDDDGPQPLPWRGEDDVAFPDDLFRLRRPTAEQRREFAYQLAAHLLVQGNRNDEGSTEILWNQLHCLVDTHRKYSSPIETIEVDVNPLPRAPLLPSREHCGNRMSPVRCAASLRERLPAGECPTSARSPRLNATARGMAATVVDCRPLRERSGELQKALQAFDGSKGVIEAIDVFGIRSTARLNDLMQKATGYLSRFFDRHLIADSNGRILFEAEISTTSGTETDESRVATPAFSSHVDISELLSADSASSDRARPGTGNNRATTVSAPSLRGRSFVETVRVEDVELRVFVHPFILDGIDVSEDSQQRSEGSPASSNQAARPTFYMVGIVDDSEFMSAAIKLRLSLVINATLILLVLLTLAPLLWFWTAGDRLVISRLGLAGVCTTPLVGVVLLVVLACGMVTNRIDEHVLDSTMEQVSKRIVGLFDQELHAEILALQRAIPRLLRSAEREEQRRRPVEGMRVRPKANTGGQKQLSQLEKSFYCDDSNRDLPYDPRRIGGIESISLMDDAGRQLLCRSGGPLTRTPKLALEFRGYFRRPKEGALWRTRPIARPRPVGCRGRDPQDRESLIPCIVNDLPESRNRLVSLPATSNQPSRVTEAPYYLERIDSIVRGDVQTVLAINTSHSEKPVAVSGVRLNSLDRAVPPQHIDFAVIDRETGRTLFHSDDDLAMATNFAEDVGGEPALWSLLHSRIHDTISLTYAGIPIRAHVRPLREGTPWALIVYRGHELEDRLTAVTTALSLFFTLLSLFTVVFVVVLLALVAYWYKPESLDGVPPSLGRAMATGSRLRRSVGATAGLALVFLFCLLWLTWTPWLTWGSWRVFRS